MNSSQCLFRELPYNSIEFIEVHGQFNNSLNNNLTTKKQLQCLKSLHDLDVFSLNINTSVNPDHNLNYKPIQCNYYSTYGFSQQKSFLSSGSSFSLLHNNVRSLRRNLDNFQSHLLEELQLHFSIIGITETKITNSNLPLDFDPSIPNYRFEYVPTPLSAGGVGMYIHNNFNYTVIERACDEAFQALWGEIHIAKKSTVICGVIYRQHNSPENFLNYFKQTVEKLSATGRRIFIMTDANINLLSYEWCKDAQEFLHLLQGYSFIPAIDKPTRVLNKSATLIDNIFINNYDANVYSGNIVSDIGDHYTQFCVCNA